MFSWLLEAYNIIKESDESIGPFPTDLVKNALAISFIDLQDRLYELRQIERDK